MAGLAGKVAVVTGSTRGIGLAIVERLAEAGVHVVVSGRTATDCERVAGELSKRNAGVRAEGIACNVRSWEDCKSLIDTAVQRLGRLDILINNAGIGAFATVTEMEPATWDAVIETNLNSLFYCTHAAMPHLVAAGESFVINIGSLAGKNAFPNGAAYNASKFGLIGFSEALMQEARYDGVRVAYIMPGSVATEFNNRVPGSEDAWRIQPEDVARSVMDIVAYPSRSLTSRIELRPSQPPRR